jgi:signal recognition particle subunit SRP54
MDPVVRAAGALASVKTLGFDTLIVDTAGRLHIDDELMAELVAIRTAVDPKDLLYVADAMTGQDAVKSAGEFHHRMGVSGVVLTKMMARARRRALSVVGVVGVPIAFVGVGNGSGFGRFTPTAWCRGCWAWRRARSSNGPKRPSTKRAAPAESKVRLDLRSRTFATSSRRSARWGRSSRCWDDRLRGGGQGVDVEAGERDMRRAVAIINSMTPVERREPSLINGSRRKRIAKGSGTTVEEVNRVLKQFVEMRKMLKTMGGMAGMKNPRRLMGMLKGR